MKIVLVMATPPTPFGKADSHWHYVLLKELVARGHQVSAFVACETQRDFDQTQALFPAPDYDVRCYPYCTPKFSNKVRSLLRPHSYPFSDAFRQALADRLADPYDVLHLEQLWSGWLGFDYPQKAVVMLHYLFSEDQAFSTANHWKNQLYGWLSHRAEQRLLQSFPRFITLSDRLAANVCQLNPEAITHTIPLGMDFSYYPFVNPESSNLAPTVSLIGSFNWAPSYSAAERLLTRLWTKIKQQVPTAQLQIVGRCAKDRLAHFGNLPDVTFHQDVPDILPYFYQTDVLLYAPIAGSGMKIKVMEAFALGTPVVTTIEGVEGLPAQDGIHAGICNDDAGLIQRTVELLESSSRQQTQRQNARLLLEQVCSPQATVSQVEQVYRTIANQFAELNVEVAR